MYTNDRLHAPAALPTAPEAAPTVSKKEKLFDLQCESFHESAARAPFLTSSRPTHRVTWESALLNTPM